jgi:DNA replication protein DnaC
VSSSPPRTFEEFLAWGRKSASDTEAFQRRRDLQLRDHIATENLRYRIAMAKKLSNVGERFAERTLDAYECPPGDAYARDIALTIAQDPCAQGVWFCGNNGSGKTHLAAGIVNAATSRGIPATYVKVAMLMEQFAESYNRNGKLRANKLDVIQWLASVDVLVLDDIDKTDFTPHTSRMLYILVDQRYENAGTQRRKPVIVTSNHEPAEVGIIWRKKGLDRKIGDTILDRFRELCGQFIAVESDSYRERIMMGRA